MNTFEHKWDGLIRDKYDPNDLIYEEQFKLKAPDVYLPNKFDLFDLCPKPRNQKSKGACVPFSCAEYMSFLTQDKNQVFSPEFIYHFSRILENTSYKDNGVSIRSALKAMKKWGVCIEELFPYDPDMIDREPNKEAILNARNYRIDKYYSIRNGLYSMKSYLYTHRLPILMGLTIFPSAKNKSVKKNGIIPIPYNEQPEGQHCVLVVGYKTVDKFNKIKSVVNHHLSSTCYLIALNSWGKDSGDCGFVYIPCEMIDRNLCFNMWIISGLQKNKSEGD